MLETLTVGPLQQCFRAQALVGRHAPDHAEPRDLLIEPRSPEIHGGVGTGFVAIADRELLRDRHPEVDLLIGPAADEFVGRDANDGRDDAAVHDQRLPTAVSDAANALRQKRALMTADAGAFGASSSGISNRPRSGDTPRVAK